MTGDVTGDVTGAMTGDVTGDVTDAPNGAGLLLVYTGDGKGKTTAALGAVFRALGYGDSVAVVQFVKGRRDTGEWLHAARLPGVVFEVMGRGFTWNSDDLSRDAAAARAAWTRGLQLASGGDHGLVVLDELTYAIHYGWLGVDEVLEGLASRSPTTHVIVTGRRAPAELIDAADLVTEMLPVKHPYAAGVPAQRGLDF